MDNLKQAIIYDQTMQEWGGFTIGFKTLDDNLIFLKSPEGDNIKLFKSLEKGYKIALEIGF